MITLRMRVPTSVYTVPPPWADGKRSPKSGLIFWRCVPCGSNLKYASPDVPLDFPHKDWCPLYRQIGLVSLHHGGLVA